MSGEEQKKLVGNLDTGQVWVRWTPELAEEEPTIAAAVANFEAKGMTEGKAAASAATFWLRYRSLPNYRTTVTWLMLSAEEDFVEGFYSLASAQSSCARAIASHSDPASTRFNRRLSSPG